MKKIADFIVDKRKYVMILYLIILVISVVGMLHVNVNYDMSKYLPRESFTKLGMEKMSGEYGDLASITVMFDDLDEKEQIKIKEDLASVPNVKSVVYLQDDESYQKDGHSKYMVAVSAGTYSNEARKVLEEIKDRYQDYEIAVSGAVVDNDLLIKTLAGEIPVIAIIVVVIIFAILFLLCDSWIEPFLYMGCIGVAILINMGTNVIPKLSVELVSDVMQIDEYWTLNGNHDLAEFSGTTTTENYGELANMAKVRLKVKDGITSGEEVKGTLTVKANGTAIMVLELTGIAGAPVIVTDSIPEAVKYVPYGTMIQNSNKYSKTKVKYILDSGTLPEGMQFMENGELYGVPKEVGTFEFWVRMASTNPDSSMTKKFTLVVKENTDANVDAATDAGYEVTQRIPSVALNSSGSYTFVSQGVLNEFIDVYLDGEKLARDVDYNAESGSTRLTISSQTLTRSNTTGTHTLGVEFRTTNENMLKSAAQNFNVLTEGSSTGDPDSSGDSGSSGGSSSSGDSGSDSNSNDNPGSTESAANTSDNAPAGAIVTGNGGNSAGTASGAAAGTAAGSEPIIYTIVSGDTLSKIALKHYGNASLWTKIYEDNRDIISNPDVIRVGWQIKIYPMAAGDTANVALTNANQTDTEQGNTGTTVDGTYVVQSGDTLWKISKKIYGWGWQWRKIYDANRDTIQAPGVLHMGQVIIIP